MVWRPTSFWALATLVFVLAAHLHVVHHRREARGLEGARAADLNSDGAVHGRGEETFERRR
ncbi:MAG TPA: hypothetical protein VHM88_15100 [Candidatus Acidoferrales bacterium]|jgi:hypothetical protein|nr:hypothetical protein [Candidatus Acidoferrales bacterium]